MGQAAVRRSCASQSDSPLVSFGSQWLDRLQRVCAGEAPWAIGELPLTEIDLLHLTGQCLPRHTLVFDQSRQLHAGIEQGGHDFSEPVVPRSA